MSLFYSNSIAIIFRNLVFLFYAFLSDTLAILHGISDVYATLIVFS
ncbi:hypothetical protein [Marinitoga sp. 1155]|nr:hypothetical protein [Marinitoga sp. 1155]